MACWAATNGGQTYHTTLGGGGELAIECALQTHFWRPPKWDWFGRCPFPLMDMTERGQSWRKRIIGGGGGQNNFWKGVLWYAFPFPESFAVRLPHESRNGSFGADFIGFRRPARAAKTYSSSNTPFGLFFVGLCGYRPRAWARILGADFGCGFWVRTLVQSLRGFWRGLLAPISAQIV